VIAITSRAPVNWRIGVYDAPKIGEYAKNLDLRRIRKDTPKFWSPASAYRYVEK